MVDMGMGGSVISVSATHEDVHPGLGSENALLEVRDLRKEYVTGRGRLLLFDGLSFSVRRGEMLGIVGTSGAGKSTLLHILGALDAPTSGALYFASIHLNKLSSRQAADFRNREVGYVWQFHYLLPEFTALENVSMPLLIRGVSRTQAASEAQARLDEVGLGARSHHRAGELSGGEQQRVVLARALVGRPSVLLADEPTGNLDFRTGEMIFELLEGLHRTHHLTSVFVTHNLSFARRCSRVLSLERGGFASGQEISQPGGAPEYL